MVKNKLRYMQTPDDRLWRPILGAELLKVRDDEVFSLPGFNSDEIELMLTYICVS